MHVIFLISSFWARAAAALPRCPAACFPAAPPLFAASALLTFLLTAFPAAAGAAGGRQLATDPQLPSAYGEIIYRINEESAGQVYIIGISHRDAENRLNNGNTVRTQAEVFRIGEWLNSNRQLELLLPEGYFRQAEAAAAPHSHPLHSAGNSRLNNDLLLARLADESRFVNAEMLLLEQFDMHASQVEDRGTYQAVCKILGELPRESCERLTVDQLAEVQYLQEIRTARLLQKIPEAIESELAQGTIRNRAAMLTIGLNHIQDIIRYIQENSIKVAVPRRAGSRMENYQAEPELLRQGYGITIIIPRTLADDRALLQLTNLDRLLLAEEVPRPGN